MAGLRQIITGFFGGELDPLMSGRVDTDNYSYGLDTCENFVALSMGPLVKRQGFEYVRAAAPTAGWLSTFRFSIEQEYVLEWSDNRVRYFTNGGRIETAPNVPYETMVPYSAAQAPFLSTQQSYDRLYIDHAGFPPSALARTSATTFSYGYLEMLNGPFADDNANDAITVTANATTGAVTITASTPIFNAGHLGSLFRIQARDFANIKAWEPGMTGVVIGDIVRSDGKVYTALTAGTTGSVQPTHAEGTEWDGQLRNDLPNSTGPYGVQWQYRHDRFGIVKISSFGDMGASAAGQVTRRLPDSVTTIATSRWAHSAFSDAAGWPELVTIWAGRQVHFKGLDMVASVVGDYGGGKVNFATFTSSGSLAADLAFRRTLATEDPPLWVVPDLKRLLIGTASKELAIGPTNTQAAISGDNISAEPQSFYGSEKIQPAQIAVNSIFVERGGRRIRASGYDFARDRYAAEDLTAAARHVTQSGLRQLAYSRVPYPMLFALRQDGEIAMHCDSKTEIKGFSRMVLGGEDSRALSIASVVGADGKSDELWLLVERPAHPSGTRREIWRQTTWREPGDPREESFFVDAGVRIAASAGQVNFTGLVHLAGCEVAVLADGGVIPGMAVSDLGVLTLPGDKVPQDRAYVLIVGLPYTALAVTLRPDARGEKGPIQGLRLRVRKMVLRLLDSAGLRVGGAMAEDRNEEIVDRRASDFMDRPIDLYTGDAFGSVAMDFRRDGRVRFLSDVPLPGTVTAAMLSLEVDGGDA